MRGPIEEKARQKSPADPGLHQRILEQARAGFAHVASPERFALLWTNLESSGMFSLPRHPGREPPEDQQSILIGAEGRTWVLLRPDPRNFAGDAKELERLLRIWGNIKTQIVNFHP